MFRALNRGLRVLTCFPELILPLQGEVTAVSKPELSLLAEHRKFTNGELVALSE